MWLNWESWDAEIILDYLDAPNAFYSNILRARYESQSQKRKNDAKNRGAVIWGRGQEHNLEKVENAR